MTGYEGFRKGNFVPISDRIIILSALILILGQILTSKKIIKLSLKLFLGYIFQVKLMSVSVRNMFGCK